MGEYTALTILAVVLATLADLFVLRTRLVRTASFWLSMAIMWFFQIFVDGWLTKASAPIVRYDEDELLGIRLFFHSPIEDFAFGYAMVLWTLSLWRALGRRPSPTPVVGGERVVHR